MNELRRIVADIVERTPVFDLHTHLFAPAFGPALNLWGIDELLTYHYLVAEVLRTAPDVSPGAFWARNKAAQADLIWKTLFVENTPVSEATRGVVKVLSALGLDPAAPDLRAARAFFAEQQPEAYLDQVLALAGVSDIVMTNDPFSDDEAAVWQNNVPFDKRFHAALRLDGLLNSEAMNAAVARGFLDKQIARMKPLYAAVSLPSDWVFPDNDSPRGRLMSQAVLPVCREHDLPLALMIGVRRGVNPALRLAGDGVGLADVGAVERLCAAFPANRFLVTLLARENQHALCVAARKFANLLPFGCWWFLNNPSIITEITRERFELLGTTFVFQHSDARVLDQLLYKWAHARTILANVLSEQYEALDADGKAVTPREIERDVVRLFSGNFRAWVKL